MRVLLEDGPCEGIREVDAVPEKLDLYAALDIVGDHGAVIARYLRMPSDGDDFIRAIDARYRWDGMEPSELHPPVVPRDEVQFGQSWPSAVTDEAAER